MKVEENTKEQLVEELTVLGRRIAALEATEAEHKQAEKHLLQLEKAVETMPLGMTITDLNGKIIYTNPADAAMHGYRTEELLGKDVSIFAPAEFRKPRTLEQIEEWKGMIRESINIRKDGKTFPVWLMSEIVKSAEGKPCAIVTSCEDITDRKWAEEELRKRLRQRNILLELTKAVNTTRELPDLLNFIVKTSAELLNAEASSLLLQEEDVLRFEIAYGEKETEVKKFTIPLGSGIAGSVAISGKSTFINEGNIEGSGIFKAIDMKSGFITRNLICVPLLVQERIIGVIEVVNRRNKDGFSEDDVSLLEGFASQAAIAIERAQLVEKRIQAERLATIGQTVAGLAHCIKNITNALKAGEYVVDKGFRDKDMERLKKGWEITKQGSERIRNLVLDMLTISKKREPEYTNCCPHEIMTEVVAIVEEKVKGKNVTIETTFDQEIGQVRVDRKGIFRCLLNLITNALDACKNHQGIIQVETFQIGEKPFFGFRVSDNGHGISEADQKKLFHEFFSTKGSQGTGLGLSVTHAIVTEHGGSIRCDSQPGKGTIFTIELPIN